MPFNYKNNSVLTLQKVAIGICVAALFCIANLIQRKFLYPISIGPRASLFYLPAAIVTLGSLISPLPSLLGIFVGALILNEVHFPSADLFDVALLSSVPVLAAIAALISTAFFNPRFREFHGPQERFSQINAIDIFYFCCLYAVFNVSLSKLLYYFELQDAEAFPPVMVLGMAFGDLTGSFLVFIFLNLVFSFYLRFMKRESSS